MRPLSVAELKSLIAGLPDDMPVTVATANSERIPASGVWVRQCGNGDALVVVAKSAHQRLDAAVALADYVEARVRVGEDRGLSERLCAYVRSKTQAGGR